MTGSKITTILFDCDNTLVLSEPVAFEASADLTNEILASRNIDLRFTGPQLQREFVGLSFQAMMPAIEKKYNVSCNLTAEELEEYAGVEDDRVIAKLMQKLQPCEGANAELDRLARLGEEEGKAGYRLAVVSSSALRRVRASLDKAGQAGYFDPAHVFSAADSLPAPASKPDPAVYLHALGALGRAAAECVAVEDSRSGATAARRAGIACLGYTGACEDGGERERMRAVLEGAGCRLVMSSWDQFPDSLAKLERGEI